LHIHFSAWADGYRPYGGEARFSDDPRRGNDAERAELIELVVDAEGLQHGELVVPLQRKR
jgi:hypothetical protein